MIYFSYRVHNIKSKMLRRMIQIHSYPLETDLWVSDCVCVCVYER